MEALYIHIPFCDKICTYCDFYKMVSKLNYKTKYVSYLIREMEMRKELLRGVKTVYIGGGTPSSLPVHLLDFMLYHLFTYVDIKNVEEFTIELNPIDVTDELCILLNKYRVNRVSLGVQSFQDDKLKFLGRTHDRKGAIQAIKTLKKHKIININVDFIYATPHDSFRSVKKDLTTAINLNVTHVSAYSLILEEKTKLYHLYKQNLYQRFDEDKEFKIYQKLRRFLRRFGYYQYEISNYAKKNYKSRHNYVYWSNEKYLGIGAGASYYIDNIRYTNRMNLNEYFRGIDEHTLVFEEVSELTKIEQMQEEVILGLRKIEGVDLNRFQEKFGTTLQAAFPFIQKLMDQKLLHIRKNRIKIPKNKLYLSNVVLTEFI